ncbi:MAG TPA: hypothetical protein VNT32_07340 [Thermoleophilaceae bacterium]|nr:hypothetical protein [Thermoleophilaceae bacterium]
MNLLAAWLLFPLTFAVLATGCGLLVERASGRRLAGVLIVPLGFAAMIVVTYFFALSDGTAELATPAVVLVALAGFAAGFARLRESRPDRAGGAAFGIAFFVLGAPVFLSGEATFAGYTLLGDHSIHMLLADWVSNHGQASPAIAPSSYQAALSGYIDTAYPLGAHTALGALLPLSPQDVAWIYHPYLSLIAALVALCAHRLLGEFVESRLLLLAGSVAAAVPALVYGYHLQGSVKELATVLLIALAAALIVEARSQPPGPRRAVPFALVAAAGLGVLNLAFLPWLGPLALAAAALVLSRSRLRAGALEIAAGGALTAALAIPSFTKLGTFRAVAENVLTSENEFGNLAGALQGWQAFGIWPVGDYRFGLAENTEIGYVMIGVAAAAAALGIIWVLRVRPLGVFVVAAASAIGSWYAVGRGSPWADGKALMILSPALVLLAVAGIEGIRRSGRRAEALVVGLVVIGGIAWTDVLAYRSVSLAPRDRMEELADIGEGFAGKGPALYIEFEEFAKYFLRAAQPVGSSENWQPEPKAGGTRFGFSSDLDQLHPDFVRRHRTLVLRRGVNKSRPGADYALAWTGRYYEVWRRTARPEVIRHLPVGDNLNGSARPECGAVRELAEVAREHDARLAYVRRSGLASIVPTHFLPLPPKWTVDGNDPLSVQPTQAGRIEGALDFGDGGLYDVWLEGSFGREIEIALDGRLVGRLPAELNPRGSAMPVARVRVPAGTHTFAIIVPGGSLAPGNGPGLRLIGPLLLRPVVPGSGEVETIAPADAEALCRTGVDWVEVVRP